MKNIIKQIKEQYQQMEKAENEAIHTEINNPATEGASLKRVPSEGLHLAD
jgi:hypothetical protein